jgi:recombination protein RecT
MDITTHKQFLFSENVQKNLCELLGTQTRARQFATAIFQIVQNNDLTNINPKSVYKAAMHAIELGLNVSPSLGHCYFIKYWNSKNKIYDVKFILGYKGLIQLALRTNQYRRIASIPIYKRESPKWDRINEEMTITQIDITPDDEIVGYYSYFETIHGFKKACYWTIEQVIAHAKKYSKSKNEDGELFGVWVDEFNDMACKTVLLSIMKTYAIVSNVLVEVEEEEEQDTKDIEYIELKENAVTKTQWLHDSIAAIETAQEAKELKKDVMDTGDSDLIEMYNAKVVSIDCVDLIIE